MPAVRRSDLLRSLDRSQVMLAASALLIAVIELSLAPLGEPGGWLLAAPAVTFLIYIGAGLVAWHRRPANATGALIVFAGFALSLAGLATTGVPVLVAVGIVCATLVLPAIIHLLLAFPTGRLDSAPARAITIAAYVVSTLLEAPRYLLDPGGPLQIGDAPALRAGLQVVQSATGAVVMILVAGILAVRWVRADGPHRRLLIPVYGFGALAVLMIPFSALVLSGALGMSTQSREIIQFLVIAGVPIAFAIGITRGGFERTGEWEQLGAWLAAQPDSKDSLESALSRTLGDASVRLSYAASDGATSTGTAFVDEAGRSREQELTAPGRGRVEIVREDRTIGVITYNAALVERDRVVTAGTIVAIAIEAQRLTAELLSSQRELRRSRERIVDAGDKERRRIAQDLHDGLQVTLVLLALEARGIGAEPGVPPTTAHRALQLRDDIGAAAAELRRLVHALVPAALIERGLGAATRDVAGRMPIPTSVDIGFLDGDLPESTETVAYFVVTEALANIVKHAEAATAGVRIDRSDDTLLLEIRDDGKGGADASAGSGLTGLADRVDVAGGTMQVRSPHERGTVITVELPCAS